MDRCENKVHGLAFSVRISHRRILKLSSYDLPSLAPKHSHPDALECHEGSMFFHVGKPRKRIHGKSMATREDFDMNRSESCQKFPAARATSILNTTNGFRRYLSSKRTTGPYHSIAREKVINCMRLVEQKVFRKDLRLCM